MTTKQDERLEMLYGNNPQTGMHPEKLPNYWFDRMKQIENGPINYQGPGWYSFDGKIWQWAERQDWFAAELGAKYVDNKLVKKYIQK